MLVLAFLVSTLRILEGSPFFENFSHYIYFKEARSLSFIDKGWNFKNGTRIVEYRLNTVMAII